MKSCRLGELAKGISARIVRVDCEMESKMGKRLLEMGIMENQILVVAHEAPLGRDPIAIRIRGALIALGQNEANLIEVQEVSS